MLLKIVNQAWGQNLVIVLDNPIGPGLEDMALWVHLIVQPDHSPNFHLEIDWPDWLISL